MRRALTLATAIVLLAPLAARADGTKFEARVEAVDLLDSDVVAAAIAACTADADPAPEHIDVEVTVDDQGVLADMALAPDLGSEVTACIRSVLAELPYPAVAEGFTASHRIKIEPAPTEEDPGPRPEDDLFADPDPSRIVYAQTAIPREEGVFDATVHNLGYWVLEYGFHENVAAGLKLILPIGFVAFTPNIRTGFQVDDKVWLGGSVNYTFVTPYFENLDDFYFMTYGGTLSLSAGSDSFLFNFALTAQGVTIIEPDEDAMNEGFFLPQLGVSLRLHEKVKFNLELAPPLTTDAGFMEEYGGRVWIVMYGIRIHGESLYGDISFVWPAFEEAWEVMKYVPMGFPMLSFGFQIGGGDE